MNYTKELVDIRAALIFGISENCFSGNSYLPNFLGGFRLVSNRPAADFAEHRPLSKDIKLPFMLKVKNSMVVESKEFFVLNQETIGLVTLVKESFKLPLRYCFNSLLPPGFGGKIFINIQNDIDISTFISAFNFVSVTLVSFATLKDIKCFTKEEIEAWRMKLETRR